MTKVMKSNTLTPSPADLERLAHEYNEYWTAEEGYEVALAGGDDPVVVMLAPGDQYSTVEYCADRGFYWNHHNVVEAPDEDEQDEYEGLTMTMRLFGKI